MWRPRLWCPLDTEATCPPMPQVSFRSTFLFCSLHGKPNQTIEGHFVRCGNARGRQKPGKGRQTAGRRAHGRFFPCPTLSFADAMPVSNCCNSENMSVCDINVSTNAFMLSPTFGWPAFASHDADRVAANARRPDHSGHLPKRPQNKVRSPGSSAATRASTFRLQRQLLAHREPTIGTKLRDTRIDTRAGHCPANPAICAGTDLVTRPRLAHVAGQSPARHLRRLVLALSHSETEASLRPTVCGSVARDGPL